MTGPKVKALSRGVGRRNLKHLKQMRQFHSSDDLTPCMAGLVEQPVMVLLRGWPEATVGGGLCTEMWGQKFIQAHMTHINHREKERESEK